MDLTLVKAAADYALKAIDAIKRADSRTRGKWEAALPRLQKAVLETQLYLALRADGQPTDRRAETRLVRLWRDAASAFYRLDGELSARLQLKAEYWTEPEAWSREQISDAGISLQHVAEHTRQLLLEGK